MSEFDAPREHLIRMVRGEVRSDGDGRTLVGYAARFNSPTTIDSWEGKFLETIAPGAFKRALQQNRGQIKILFNHGMDPSIGDKPLGVPTVMREDDKGLYIEVPLAETSYNEDLRALLAVGAIDGMSFRFSVPKGGEDWQYPDKGLPIRTLKNLNLYEVGPVTFPAYQATTAGVRSREEFSIWRDHLTQEQQAEVFQIVTRANRSASPVTDVDVDALGADMQDVGDLPSSVTQDQRDALASALASLRGVTQ